MDDWRHEWEIDPATLEIGPKVGEGEFGTVHKVRWANTGSRVSKRGPIEPQRALTSILRREHCAQHQAQGSGTPATVSAVSEIGQSSAFSSSKSCMPSIARPCRQPALPARAVCMPLVLSFKELLANPHPNKHQQPSCVRFHRLSAVIRVVCYLKYANFYWYCLRSWHTASRG